MLGNVRQDTALNNGRIAPLRSLHDECGHTNVVPWSYRTDFRSTH
jgi:hypothetical protein